MDGVAPITILMGSYALATDLIAPATPYTAAAFALLSTVNGLGHTITGLTINAPSMNGVGLFGSLSGVSTVRNLGLIGGSVTGGTHVGGLAGDGFGDGRFGSRPLPTILIDPFDQVGFWRSANPRVTKTVICLTGAGGCFVVPLPADGEGGRRADAGP